MTDLIQRVFTATEEARYADDLRAERDRTDADIAARGRWEREAMIGAARTVFNDAARAATVSVRSALGDPYDVEALDLDGATLTVTISDLVATATLTLPDTATETTDD